MTIFRPFNIPLLKEEEQNQGYLPYVVLDKLFSDQELNKIIELWDDNKAKEGTVSATNVVNYDTRKARELFLKAPQTEWIYNKIATTVTMINAIRFKFSINGFLDPMRMIRYDEGCFFNWHMDYNGGLSSNRKLVISIQLSEPDEYEGGELQVLTDQTSLPKAKGTVAIFPSYIMHRVAPISKGSRLALIALISGPPFK